MPSSSTPLQRTDRLTGLPSLAAANTIALGSATPARSASPIHLRNKESQPSPSQSTSRSGLPSRSRERDGSPDLDVDWLGDGWLSLLRKWIGEAERAGVAEPNAMVLAAAKEGRPVSRSVRCKGVDEDGIVFFTNYDSAKGEELAATPYASATFPWYLLNRQFHIRGPVTKVDPQDTESYWNNRPRGSQLGAWASHQSRPIESR